MAFPTGWERKCEITIDADEVDAALTDFPLLCTEDNLPSEMFDADGSYPAQNGGGDIRFSSDEEGTTQLACDVVSFVTDNDPANGSAQIHVKVPSVSSSSDTTIYVWYNTSGTDSQPAVSDTYGRNAVWSGFDGVWHHDEDPSGTIVDSTGSHDATSSGSMTSGDEVTAVVGNGFDFDGSDDMWDIGNQHDVDGSTSVSLSCWINSTQNSGPTFAAIAGKRPGHNTGHTGYNVVLTPSNGRVRAEVTDGTDLAGGGYTTAINDGSDHHVAMVLDRSDDTLYVYVDGVERNTDDASSVDSLANSDDFAVASLSGGSDYFDGIVDEVRVALSARSAADIAAEHSNQSGPGTFAAAGTPESTSSGVTITPSALSLTLSPAAPTLSFARNIAPAAVSTALSVAAPTLSLSRTLTPSAIPVTLAIAAPTLQLSQTLTPAPLTLSLGVAAPVLSLSRTITPAAGSLSLTVAPPTINQTRTLTPAAVELSLSVAAPTLSLQRTLTPAAIAAALNVAAPTLAFSRTLTPDALALVLSLPAITISPRRVLPAPLTLTLSVAAPTIILSDPDIVPDSGWDVTTRHGGWQTSPRLAGYETTQRQSGWSGRVRLSGWHTTTRGGGWLSRPR